MQQRAYLLLERLSNLLRSDLRRAGEAESLEPVLLQALDYLARANRYSDTPAAVTEYLGLTKGNVSQRLLSLERAGLIRRHEDAEDRRVSHLEVTARGREVLRAAVPPPAWRKALAGLSTEDAEHLATGLGALLAGLQRVNGFRTFGECRSCRHLQRDRRSLRCGLTGDALTEPETASMCREHEGREASPS